MKWLPLMFVVTLGASVQAHAHAPALPHGPLHAFDALLGNWQCQAQQMHIGLDHFDLEYIDATVALQVSRRAGCSNIDTSMQAVSNTQETLFETSGLITYDPQRTMFVQYETTSGGADATLYSRGFVDGCLTWRYAADIKSLKAASPEDIIIEATYCLAEHDSALHIDYTLHLAEHDPFVLFTASCDREAWGN